ncbi:hypothetical protein [Virgibacillus oceani]|nr:hypothetical protein [Virgibacillus oceani]
MEQKQEQKLKQNAAFFRASHAGVVREIALNSGGTGDLRKEISSAEAKRMKRKRKLAKQSRRRNR